MAGSLAFGCSCVAGSVSLRSRKSQEIARSFTTGGRSGARTEAFVTMDHRHQLNDGVNANGQGSSSGVEVVSTEARDPPK